MFDKYCVRTNWLHALEKKNGVSGGGWKLIASWWGDPALDGVCLC